MEPTGFYLLNVLIYLPLLGAIAVLFVPRSLPRTIERLAFFSSILSLALSAWCWVTSARSVELQFAGSVDWISQFHIRYSLGLDGFSLPMVLLTSLISSVCIYFSWGRVGERVREYYFFILLLECFLLGVFSAQDLFLFYVLFDATLIPTYFLIAIWGGERGPYAAIRFLLYTLAGSAAMLIGVLWVYFQSAAIAPNHEPTFDISTLARLHVFSSQPLEETLLFGLFAAAFLVKIPIFPLHSWLPDAYCESPPAVVAVVAGVLGKMGVYGFLRIALPLFPNGAHDWANPLMVMGVISIVYGALVALAQWDLKRLVAYSSVSHMGFIALGLATAAQSPHWLSAQSGDARSLALTGILFEMFGHGLITASLFLLIGVLEEQVGTRDLRTLTGAFPKAPVYVVLFCGAMFATMGFPGLIGFWGELYVLLGAFQVFKIATGISALGIILTAGFFVWALQRMAFGVTSPTAAKLKDVDGGDIAGLSPLFALILIFGIFPAWYLTYWSSSILQLANLLSR